MKRPLCIFHSNCADGFTAAWAVWKALGDIIDFHPGVYGVEPPDVSGRHVIMVDFSYKRSVLLAMERSAKSITVLDHHKTAQADLAGFACEGAHALDADTFAETQRSSQGLCIRVLFDMDRSGAQIAWDYFHPGKPRPKLVDYVGDRDLWRLYLPLSREVNAFIFAHKYTFENWDHLDGQLRDQLDVHRIAEMGAAIEQKHHKDVAELVKITQRTMIIGGYAVPVANIPYTLASDAGNLMARRERFAACYWDTPTGRVFSLRSTDDGLDVSAIAQQYGGGGHRNASGFQMPLGWEGDSEAKGEVS